MTIQAWPKQVGSPTQTILSPPISNAGQQKEPPPGGRPWDTNRYTSRVSLTRNVSLVQCKAVTSVLDPQKGSPELLEEVPDLTSLTLLRGIYFLTRRGVGGLWRGSLITRQEKGESNRGPLNSPPPQT